MGIPDYQSLMRPVLVALSDGVTRSTRETKEAVIASLDLTEQEKAEVLPSGNQLTVDNRVGWAISYLVAAGAVERPSRARLRISQAGRELLVDHPDRVDNQVLMKFEAFREFRAGITGCGAGASRSRHPSKVAPSSSSRRRRRSRRRS